MLYFVDRFVRLYRSSMNIIRDKNGELIGDTSRLG